MAASRADDPMERLEEPIIVKADEVDQTGTVLSSDGTTEDASAPSHQITPLTIRTSAPKGPKPLRPVLTREGSAPPPPLQPPPPAPQSDSLPDAPTDSLSLPQLRQLVSQFPKVEQTAYAFQYADSQSFPEEIEEWFQYMEPERMILVSSKETFEKKWADFSKSRNIHEQSPSEDYEPSWLNVPQSTRREFLYSALDDLHHSDILVRIEASEVIFYILAGVWGLTAGLTPTGELVGGVDEDEDRLHYNRVQIEWMQKGVLLMSECKAITSLSDYLQRLLSARAATDYEQADTDEGGEAVRNLARRREWTILLSSWYIIIETARQQLDESGRSLIRNAIIDLKSNFMVNVVYLISTLRWDDHPDIPLTKLLLVFWKSLLLIFGGDAMYKRAKDILQPNPAPFSPDASHPVLTASPLDYHFFRQEITSKYPAYNPPPPLIPLELEHKSILPPLPNHPSRANTAASSFGGMGTGDMNTNSIFHQPVHIATPAPSPPPSPIGPGGKAGKKQNYQTNQNFPLLYPPLDDSSNQIGGKGSSNLQDTLVSKRWEGSDVPASIMEAGQLFASRMRMTRAMKQLWRERELSMKDDRGWLHKSKHASKDEHITDNDDLGEEGADALNENPNASAGDDDPKGGDDDDEDSLDETDDAETQTRLNLVEDFYHGSLAHMQSFVIVLLKTTLINVQAIAMANGSPSSATAENGQQNGLPRNKSNMSLSQYGSAPNSDPSMSFEDLDNIRLREISHKAISGALMLMLKWFKISHILKFEYLTQLLLDSSYIPLILKFFAHQNMEDIVAQKNDRDDLGFFHSCHLNSDHPPLSPTSPLPEDEASSPDEAVPPPISRHRRSPTSETDGGVHPQSPSKSDPSPAEDFPPRPAVDELGNPIAPLPATPITHFSWRNFFTSINFLRILQKITRQKAHRCLLLVQYKSSTILRKNLKIPDPMLRLYTLKLFKSQVPYCGRKWRQSNMRVITAIYLHCRPELRDEWLAGMHDSNIEGEVDEALPLEQALRALTHWWHLRRYRDVMGANDEDRLGTGDQMNDEEQDFFTAELNNMGWGPVGGGPGDEFIYGEDVDGRNGVVEGGGVTERYEAGGPLQMEGW